MVEDYISQKLQIQDRDEDQKRGKKKKLDGEVYTPEWREAVIHVAERVPMSVLIEEFNRYYKSRIISAGTSVRDIKGDVKSSVQRGKEKEGESIHIPQDVLSIIFLRLPLHDLLACRSVSDYWASACASNFFRENYRSTEKCIVINNHNLDMWVFSIISKSWFLLKVPCNWDTMGMKTLGIKASSEGLFLVARSDYTLHVVNPLTAQVKSLPIISPTTRNRGPFLNLLVVHGTAEMETDNNTGHFRVYLFGNWYHDGKSLLHIARYNSITEKWTMKPLCPFLGYVPVRSKSFPSPLWSYKNDTVIYGFSAIYQYFHYLCNDPVNNNDKKPYAEVHVDLVDKFPETIQIEKHDEDALPAVIPHISGQIHLGMVFVGRMKQNDVGKQVYGRLPIVCHTDIGLWEYNPRNTTWSMIDTIPIASIESMIKSSEGTDFIVVGDGHEDIWLMLRGGETMLHYKLGTRQWLLEPGCLGEGYMDANIYWKATFENLKFNAKVNV